MPSGVVTVLYGGVSAEREVSLKTGEAIVNALIQDGYDVRGVDVRTTDLMLPDDCATVFPALHGTFGEDGRLQDLLEDACIPYVGAGPGSSRAAFDKAETRRILVAAGIPMAAGAVLSRGEAVPEFKRPVVVKPACEGSSVGLCHAADRASLVAGVEEAFKHGDRVVVESFIAGRELTVGIVDGQVLPVVEVMAPEGWYDYRAKYTAGTSAYQVPAQLPPDVTERCQDVGLRVYEALACEGMGRVDIRLGEDGVPYVLELNTLPGFTPTSLLPKAAAAAGIPFPDLCDRLVRTAACGKPKALAMSNAGGSR